MSTKYLDLDAIAEETKFVLKLNGKEHPLRVATVATFTENMKDLQSLALNADLTEEVRIIVGVVKRSFPTMSDEEIGGLMLPQLHAIAKFGLDANGQNVEAEKKDEEGNAPRAD